MNATRKPTAVFVCGKQAIDRVYPEPVKSALAGLAEFPVPPQTRETILGHDDVLRETEIIFGSWGMIPLDAAFLKKTPRLRAVFYGAGTVKPFVTDAMWDRGVRISTCKYGLAISVAEYTVAQVLLTLKKSYRLAAIVKEKRRWATYDERNFKGNFGTRVGLIGMGLIGRLVLEKLESFDHEIVVHDPYLPDEEAARLRVENIPLDALFATSDVVSLHAPITEETRGMLRGHHFESMMPDGIFINTARGILVNEPEMIAVLQARPDIQAVLDVTYPEPPPTESPLYDLPNVVLTPHIAGLLGDEQERMGWMMLDELRRFLANEPLRFEVDRDRLRYEA